MSCICRKKIKRALEKSKREVHAQRGILRRRLEAFREGIQSGAEEQAARHLFRAGVYWGSLDNNLVKEISFSMILQSLRKRLEGNRELSSFLSRNEHKVAVQMSYFDPADLLTHILRKKEKAKGLLEAGARNEITRGQDALLRLRELKDKLRDWREAIRTELKPKAIYITDIHNEKY